MSVWAQPGQRAHPHQRGARLIWASKQAEIGLFETNHIDKHTQKDVMMIFVAAEETTLCILLVC